MTSDTTWYNWEVQVSATDDVTNQSTYCIVKDDDEYVTEVNANTYIEECSTSAEEEINQDEWQLVQMSQVTKSAAVVSQSAADKVKCPECSKSYTSGAYLKEHMRIHTGEKPYACDECGIAFAQKCNLRMHIRIHTGERPFMCQICGKTFSRSSHLKGHSLQHSGIKPYSCDICGQQFTNSQGKKHHMMLHLGDRPFRCEICNITFIHKASLKCHVKSHRKEARYCCTICKRKFIFRTALYEHMTFHGKTKLYECNQCHKRFKQKNYLKKHKNETCSNKNQLSSVDDAADCESGGSSVREASQLKYRVLRANEKALPQYDTSEEEDDVEGEQLLVQQDAITCVVADAASGEQHFNDQKTGQEQFGQQGVEQQQFVVQPEEDEYLDPAFAKVVKRAGQVR